MAVTTPVTTTMNKTEITKTVSFPPQFGLSCLLFPNSRTTKVKPHEKHWTHVCWNMFSIGIWLTQILFCHVIWNTSNIPKWNELDRSNMIQYCGFGWGVPLYPGRESNFQVKTETWLWIKIHFNLLQLDTFHISLSWWFGDDLPRVDKFK